MPKDSDIARALATAITAADTGRIKKAEFRYDPYLEMDKLPDTQVFLTSQRMSRARLARGNFWQKDCELWGVLMVKQGPNDTNAEEFIDRWLDDLEKVFELIESTTVLGHKAVEIESDERYSRASLNGDKRLIVTWSIAYKAI